MARGSPFVLLGKGRRRRFPHVEGLEKNLLERGNQKTFEHIIARVLTEGGGAKKFLMACDQRKEKLSLSKAVMSKKKTLQFDSGTTTAPYRQKREGERGNRRVFVRYLSIKKEGVGKELASGGVSHVMPAPSPARAQEGGGKD